MKIYTKIVLNSETLEVLYCASFDYCGRIDFACGASSQQKEAYANQQKVSSLLTSNMQKFFGDNEAILKNITTALTPIESAGPSQFGMSAAETAAERTGAAEQLSAAGQKAAGAVRGALAARGGGTSITPSGSEAAIEGELAQQTAVQQALAQNQITQRGYDIGRDNFWKATSGLATAPAELENPVVSAGSSANAGAQAQSQAGNDITQANHAWIAPVAGIAGALGGAALTQAMKPPTNADGNTGKG